MELLKFGIGNAKLKGDVGIFDLPASWSCPRSKDCGDKVNPVTGKLIKNPNAKFRCFAATSELISPATRRKRWHNFNLIKECKTTDKIAELIINTFKNDDKLSKVAKIRIHSSGDFFNENYFKAWMLVAKAMPEKIFYAYTKSFVYWIKNTKTISSNFHIIASSGSKDDKLIEQYNLKTAEIVYSLQEAIDKGLEIDHDDSHCYDRNCQKFALLIHGPQIANSEASHAVMKLRHEGIMGYVRGKISKGRTQIAA